MQKFHFFATSVAEWHVESDIKKILKFMDKRGLEYGVWYVPLEVNDDYEIGNFTPQVEGSVFLGKYQPK